MSIVKTPSVLAVLGKSEFGSLIPTKKKQILIEKTGLRVDGS